MPVALIVLFLLFASTGQAAETGAVAPPFVLSDTGGNTIRSSDYRGKVLLISFWAPWCLICREELVALETLYAGYRKDGLEILAISVESSPAAVSGFLRKTRLTYPVLLDPGKIVSEAYLCTHLPTTVIVDRSGIIRKVGKGYGADTIGSYEQTITELLKHESI